MNQCSEPTGQPRIGMVYCDDCGTAARMDEARIILYDDGQEFTICNNCPDTRGFEVVKAIRPVTEPGYLEDVKPYID